MTAGIGKIGGERKAEEVSEGSAENSEGWVNESVGRLIMSIRYRLIFGRLDRQ